MRPLGSSPFQQKMDAAYERMPVVLRCAFCPEWRWEGECVEGREMALQHRREAHPETFRIKSKLRKRTHLSTFKQFAMKKDQREEIYAERDRRARLHGIDVSE